MERPVTDTVGACAADVHGVPFDPALPGMALLQDPARLHEVLSHRLEAWLGPGSRLFDTRVAVRHFFPGKRCSAELELLVGPAHGAPAQRRRVLGKFYGDDHGAGVYDTLCELRTHGFGAGRFLVPRPLGYDVSHRLLLLEWMQGESLHSRLVAAPEPRESVVDAAAWLSRLHACGVTSGRQYTRTRHIETLTGWMQQLTERFPEGEHLLADVLAGIRERGQAHTDWKPGPTHRDFSPEHLVVAGDRVVGLDLDEFCQYDPLFDVAHFTVYLRFLGLTRFGALHHCDGLAEAFVAVYRAGSGEDSVERRSLYEAIAYVKLCRFVALVRSFPDWKQTLPVLLSQALQRVQ
jgi:hypothetical protein